MRRDARLRAVLAAAVLGALSLVVVDQPGFAQTGVETGWWWKGNPGAKVPASEPAPSPNLPAAPPALPAPPNVGPGQFMVAAEPDGATSIAAVRAPLDALSLTLKVAPNGNVGGANAHLFACLSSFPWTPNAGGRWDDKPLVACDLTNGGASVAGISAPDGTWTFPVAPLVKAGFTDVVIVPAAAQGAPGGLLEPFQLVFEAPSLTSFKINPPPEPAFESDDSFSDPGSGDDTFASPVVDGFDPNSFGIGDTLEPVAAPALPVADQAPRIIAPAGASAAPSTSSAQLLAMLLLLLVGGAAWMTSRQPVPAPLSLSRVAARPRVTPEVVPTAGGLGRFSRTRSGRPPSLF